MLNYVEGASNRWSKEIHMWIGVATYSKINCYLIAIRKFTLPRKCKSILFRPILPNDDDSLFNIKSSIENNEIIGVMWQINENCHGVKLDFNIRVGKSKIVQFRKSIIIPKEMHNAMFSAMEMISNAAKKARRSR